MPLYEFHTTGEGDQKRSFLTEVALGHEGKPKVVETPSGVDLPGPIKLWKCSLCEDTKFKTAGLMAKHFNSTHQAQKEGPESWRDYHEVIDGPASG